MVFENNQDLTLDEKIEILFSEREERINQDKAKKEEQNKQEVENSKKYDVVLNILKDEYFSSIETIRSVEEKANKYLVFITIIFTGFFAILNYSFKLEKGSACFKVTLYYIFVLLLVIGVCFIFLTINHLIKSLNFYQIQRVPNMVDSLEQIKNKSFYNFQAVMCRCYQEIITHNQKQIDIKQGNLKNAIKNLKKSLVSLGSAMLLWGTLRLTDGVL